MKNICRVLFTFALICCLVLPCFAAGNTMTITDVAAEPGDVIYLTVMLNEKVSGNAVGVSCTYDKEVLTPVPSSSSWRIDSLMQDFNKKGSGVWASETTENLKGTLCILAFQVNSEASFVETEVSCTVIVKNDDKKVGTFTAEATVSHICDHSFGGWTNADKMSHERKCSQCGMKETASHSWDDGVLYPKPNDSQKDLLTYTCEVCGGTKAMEVPAAGSSNEPTVPMATDPEESKPTVSTKPTEPDQSNTVDSTRPTKPVESESRPSDNQRPSDDHNHREDSYAEDEKKPVETTPYKDYNEPSESENGELIEDHGDHIHVQSDGKDMIIPIDPDKATVESADENTNTVVLEEDHDHEQNSVSIGSVCAVLGAIVLVVGICIYFVKRKH